ncbi:MAG: DUF1292 domain-containing protein [Blautia sp.]|nr:DUF1292 domain-containing protein [Lachnoclostridium sp.]MCM1210921.1 DUF1292 domain-containing protein [Blautia sp.]
MKEMNRKNNNPIDDDVTTEADGALEEMTVELDLEDGSRVSCAIVTILTVSKQDYIVLMPLNESSVSENGEVWFYRYFEDKDDPNQEPNLEYIDDDDEFEAVEEAFDEYLDSVEFDELIDEDT